MQALDDIFLLCLKLGKVIFTCFTALCSREYSQVVSFLSESAQENNSDSS